MNRSKAPTMKDLAKEAGVALGTVSKVINGIPVSKKNQEKVEKAIRTLNYEVNLYARGLKIQKTNLIALIIPDITNPFFASFVNAVESALYEQKLHLLLCCSDGIPEKEIAQLNMATNHKVDGVIALTYSDIGSYIPENLPIVVFDRYFENQKIPRVASDNFTGGFLAVEKLLELGCHHPVYLHFHSKFHGEADKRKNGYLAACEKYNLTPDYLDIINADHKELSYMKKFLDGHKRSDGTLTFDGVFAHTDYQGYLFYQLLLQEGYRVPEDVQIIGFDGIHLFGNSSIELLISSICQPVKDLAKTCVDVLLHPDTSKMLTLLPVEYQSGKTTRDVAQVR